MKSTVNKRRNQSPIHQAMRFPRVYRIGDAIGAGVTTDKKLPFCLEESKKLRVQGAGLYTIMGVSLLAAGPI
ncbi:MAG: hypothetical protein ACKN82_07555, partial [Pirellula sp.]